MFITIIVVNPTITITNECIVAKRLSLFEYALENFKAKLQCAFVLLFTMNLKKPLHNTFLVFDSFSYNMLIYET